MNPNESQELMIVQTSVATLSERFELEQRMAKLFAASGLFSDIKGASQDQAIAQAYVKIALGNSMGFLPAESMQGIDIIQGKPSVGAQLRAARMQRAGYTWTVDQCDWKGCVLTFYRGDKKLGIISYMEEDATKAGLFGKDNWKKDAPSMFFARAITRGQRRFAPGVLSLDVMSTEEAIDHTDYALVPMAAATEQKTEALATKLAEARKDADSAKGKAGSNPAPVAAQGDPAGSRTAGFDSPSAANSAANSAENNYSRSVGRASSYLQGQTGRARVPRNTTRNHRQRGRAMVTAENYKPVWAAMEAACKKLVMPRRPSREHCFKVRSKNSRRII